MTQITLQGSYNARGIGEPARPWLVRAASPDALTASDEAELRALGVDQVIDLREPAEHAQRRHTLPIVSVPLYGEAPPSAGSIETIYQGLVADRGAALTAAVIAIAEHDGVSLVHCTAGKDRTGLVVALARLAAGDTRVAVLSDYAQSGAVVRPARQQIVADQLDGIGLTGGERAAAEQLHLDSPAEALLAALDLIDLRGGAVRYLQAHGATEAHIEALRRRAVAPHTAGVSA